MFIYRITNIKNNKIYIGQTIGSIQSRWNRHKNDALNNKLNTHFARAIRKYGPESFIVEQIDTAKTQEELTKKEHDWIVYYNSIEEGYNETSAFDKCGGNTYKSKTQKELEEIEEKIRQSKLGGKNPHSTKVKCKNIETDEEFHFSSQAEMVDFFNATNHQFISRRCRGEVKSLYQGKWAIAYEDDDYDRTATPKIKSKRAKSVKVKNLETNEEKEFSSYAEAERYFGEKPRSFSSKAYKRGITFKYKEQYEITKILE